MNLTFGVCSAPLPIDLLIASQSHEGHSSSNISSGSHFNLTWQVGLLLPFILTSVATFLLKIFFTEKDNVQKTRKMPVVSYHSILKLPSFINGFYFLYRLRKDGLKHLEYLHAKYGGVFEIHLATKRVVAVLDPAAVQRVLSSSNPHHLQKWKLLYDKMMTDMLKDGLFSSDYAVWVKRRKLLSKCFTHSSHKTYLEHMNQRSHALVKRMELECSANANNSVEGKQIYSRIAWELAQTIMQSIAGENVMKDDSNWKLIDVFQRTKEIMQYRFLHPYLLIDAIWNMHPMKKEFEEARQVLGGAIQTEIDKFRANLALENTENSTIQVETECNDDNINGKPQYRSVAEYVLASGLLSDKELLAELGSFLIGGHETTTIAVNLLLFHLACNPECQKLCREEIDQVLDFVENDKDYNLTIDDLAKLKYLERCILEGLRITTVAPLLFRQISEPLKINDDFTIEAGSPVLLSPWCMHRDPKNYPNPTKFDPDRFLPKNMKERNPFTFLAFSGGPRNCLGIKYAIMEMKVIVGRLLRNFEVFTRDKAEDIEYFMELSVKPKQDISLILKRRK